MTIDLIKVSQIEQQANNLSNRRLQCLIDD